jgi:feruloyl esterase
MKITWLFLLAWIGLNPFLAHAQINHCQSFSPATPAGVQYKVEFIAADQTRPAGFNNGPTLVEHCKINGRMDERMGQDGKAYAIGFELRLPTAWNGRFLYQGGGGNDGIVRPAIGFQAAPGYALNRGFAVVSTDAGHQNPSADFGFDPIARIDNAYNAHDKVAVLAKQLIAEFYGKSTSITPISSDARAVDAKA